MVCKKCGAELETDAAFCKYCGETAYSPRSYDGRLIGFSSKIGDPAFTSYRRQSVAWSFIFSGILAVIAVIAFPIYGKRSGDIDWPYSLWYGLGIGGMFLAIALGQTLRKLLDKTYDGVVEYKDGDTGELYVRKTTGKLKKHRHKDIGGLYDYYAIGDRVRHHKGLCYYEKYDKSRDTRVLCVACASLQDMDRDNCARCSRPLLK
jgi:RNA polymerase subunit RPABC4/transcription elongation factor Spt4